MASDLWHRISNIDSDQRVGDCSICGPGSRIKPKGRGTYWACYAKDREYRGCWGPSGVARRTLGKRGLAALMNRQGGRCAICQVELDPPYADHCHTTDHIRGLLCRLCNLGLGHFQDDVDRIRAAADYVERYRQSG